MASEAGENELLVSQQKNELMAAQALDSDLEFAFRLQMEEAMAASLGLQSSSSTFQPPFKLDITEQDANVLKLQALELEKFQQEKKDHDHCEAEMRRISYNLKCRVHDEKLAREIDEMAEEDWEEYGDNFEKPIEEGCSDTAIDEPFRLYFKGLVSSEYVNGSWVSLSAIGVAVCDPGDNPVLEIQKPLGVGSCRGVAEAKALIEGLNAALSLQIRNVNVYCDYVPLYNHVIGRWIVKQRKIENLVNQVRLLERKFESFHINLLPRCHVKFVFKLARDAIDSQLTRTVEPSAGKILKETCSICLEEVDASQMFVVDACLHRYCFSCMKQHVEVKLLHGLVPGCPHEGCNTKLNVDSCRNFLSPKLVEIMIQRVEEASIPETDKFYCPYPKCSALMSRREMITLPELSSSHCTDAKSGLRKCIKCNGFFCLNCKVPWHSRMSCWDYKRLNPYPRAEDAKLQTLASQKLWRQCVKCKHMIELAEGCFHMTCRCGYEFCYTCGAEWRNKKATCSCPLWDENNILHEDDSENDDDFDEYEDYDDDDEDDGLYEYGYEDENGNYHRGPHLVHL